jgi:hypothetical protein
MNKNKELRERIANAKKELEEMEALLKIEPWSSMDIYSGLHVKTKSGNLVVIANAHNGTTYSIYGLLDSPFKAYSNMQMVSGAIMASYLNKQEAVKLEGIITDFREHNV